MANLFRLQQIGARHPRVKQYLGLKSNSRPNPERLVAIEGIWALRKAFAARAPFEALFVCPELIYSPEATEQVQDCLAAGRSCIAVSERVMKRMVDRDKPDGVAAIVRLPVTTLDDIRIGKKARVVILDALELPGNLGAIIRSADATGSTAVIITGKCTGLAHPKVMHGSMGSVFSVKTAEAEATEVLSRLRNNGFCIFTASTRGSRNYRSMHYTDRCALVLGSERFGISSAWRENEDASVKIPMLGASDSLNVGHAAVLLMYEALHAQEPHYFD
jgi:TrmH family RNA methyltransferase